MATQIPVNEVHDQTANVPRRLWLEVLHGWVTTVDHKKIGLMYIAYALIFLVIAGLNAAYYEVKYVPTMDTWDGKSELPSGAKLAGWCSLISWAAVIGFGRWTAYGLK